MKRVILLLALLLSLISFSVASAQSYTGTVTKRANLRAGPGTTFAIVGKANIGDTVIIVDQNAAGTWYQLEDEKWIAAFLVVIEEEISSDEPAQVATATPQPTVAPTPTPEIECDPSYPDLCIEVGIPDLDCGQITARRFRVLQPDPHNFDGDYDGIGCER